MAQRGCGTFPSGKHFYGKARIMPEIIKDTLTDTLKLLPFLFLTYLVMEYLEHKTGEKTQHIIRKAGRLGPMLGGALGIVPQCGFSAAASGLYAGRVISLGTLMAVYLSTSDEMLPILISEKAPLELILRILSAKAVIGITAGIMIDILCRRGKTQEYPHIHDLCEQEHCHCEKGVVRSALIHTAQIGFFLLIITFVCNLAFHFVGRDVLGNLILNHPVFGPMLAGLVGLIPNCAGSVLITQLYLKGAMNLGAAMAGLLSGSGVGVLVLFRVNRNPGENLRILALLYGIGTAVGIVIGLM